ncbi:MAG: 30S ribosomal protein S5 [Mycoplasmoidaceae bacterium]|nr:30S ribosomal protein S5 [Mycoplasmoidaceae bacterium]
MANEVKNEQIVNETAPVENKTEVKAEAKDVRHSNKPANKSDKNNRFAKKPRARVSASGFEEKVVDIKRISKTTKGGRRMRFSALVVIGDKNGKVGYGIGKSGEVPNAIKKAIKNARNSVKKVIMNKRGTVYHEIVGRAAASKVLIKPAKPGTGIVAGGAIRAVIEAAGFKDVYTKNLGSNTKMNMVQATLEGLLNQKHPNTVAKLRDKDIKNL